MIQIVTKLTFSSGTVCQARGSAPPVTRSGHSSSRPSPTTISGIRKLYGVVLSEPILVLILRCSVPPAPPCSVWPANAPMSE